MDSCPFTSRGWFLVRIWCDAPGMVEWRETQKAYSAGVKDTPTSFVFTDAQVVMESFLEDVNNILNAGDVPNLY